MHRGVLPHVEICQVKTETVHRAAQQAQPAPRDHAGIIRDQRAVENVEVGLELFRTGISGRFSHRLPHGFHIEPDSGRGEPGVNAGHRQPIRLAASMRRSVGRARRQRAQIFRDVGEVRRERQFGAEHVQLFQIVAQHAARLHAKRATHHVCRDERIAVAVAADPASHPQERRQLSARGGGALVQSVLQHAMQPRHLMQEGVVVKREAVGDLVEHGELGTAQQIGLP